MGPIGLTTPPSIDSTRYPVAGSPKTPSVSNFTQSHTTSAPSYERWPCPTPCGTGRGRCSETGLSRSAARSCATGAMSSSRWRGSQPRETCWLTSCAASTGSDENGFRHDERKAVHPAPRQDWCVRDTARTTNRSRQRSLGSQSHGIAPRHRRQSRLLCLPSGSKSEFIAQGAPIWRILVKLAAVQIWLRQYESMA